MCPNADTFMVSCTEGKLNIVVDGSSQLYVTLDHKTSHNWVNFLETEMDTSSESRINKLPIDEYLAKRQLFGNLEFEGAKKI